MRIFYVDRTGDCGVNNHKQLLELLLYNCLKTVDSSADIGYNFRGGIVIPVQYTAGG